MNLDQDKEIKIGQTRIEQEVELPYIMKVEIPMFATKKAWDKVNELVAMGYSVKGVIEHEYWHTSTVILERNKQA